MSNMSLDDTGELKKQGFGDKEPHWDEKIKWFELPDDNTPYDYRLIAKPVLYAQHWIQTKKKTGENGKAFPALCKNYDSVASKYFENGCKVCSFVDMAYRALFESEKGKPPRKDQDGKIIPPKLPDHINRLRRRTTLAHNAIIRERQKSGAPANNTGNWTYVCAIRLPQGVADNIVDLQTKFGLAKPDGSGKYGFSHRDYGKDINLTFNSQTGNPQTMYSVLIGPKDPATPLNEEEIAHITSRNCMVDFLTHLNGKYPKDEALEDSLRKFGFYDWLEKMNAAANLNQIERSAPAPTTRVSTPAGMLDDGGGMGKIPVSMDEADVPMDFPPLTAATPTQAPIAALAAAPVASVAPTAPIAAPKVATNGNGNGDIQSKLQGFAADFGKNLQVSTQEFPDTSLKFYKVGLSVPDCFTKYSANDKTTCKKCPIRLDCMMTD